MTGGCEAVGLSAAASAWAVGTDGSFSATDPGACGCGQVLYTRRVCSPMKWESQLLCHRVTVIMQTKRENALTVHHLLPGSNVSGRAGISVPFYTRKKSHEKELYELNPTLKWIYIYLLISYFHVHFFFYSVKSNYICNPLFYNHLAVFYV